MTKKYHLLLVACFVLCSCAKQDPVLPGHRESIFSDSKIEIRNVAITSSVIHRPSSIDCKYTQDSNNVIWDGTRKIFSGFATNSAVEIARKPVCDGSFVIAGLSTGELVRVNAKTRAISWVSDIYRASNMTGGADILDIVAPPVTDGNFVYAGGLGDAFCKVNKTSGAKIWCINIGVAQPFIITNVASFVLATDNTLYAIDNADGFVYWMADVKKQAPVEFADEIISVGHQQFNAKDGK